MNSRERVKAIIARKSFDRCPYSFDLTSVIAKKIAERMNIDNPWNVLAAIGDDLQYVGMGAPRGYTPKTVLIAGQEHPADEFGVAMDRSDRLQDIGDWGGVLNHPLTEPTLDGYDFPVGSAPGRFDYYNLKEIENSERYIILGLGGIFCPTWRLRGFDNMLEDMAGEEDFVNRLYDKVLEYQLGIIEQIPDCVDGIRFGEDWGQQSGLLMGPVIWRKFLKDRLKIMYGAAKKRGFDIFIHSCGDITELFPDLIEIGVEVVHPMQPEVMDVEFIKREYGKDLILYGGMGSQSTIPLGTVKDVIDEAKRRIEILGRDGGYIFGPAGAIPTDAKIENVMALVNFAMNGYTE